MVLMSEASVQVVLLELNLPSKDRAKETNERERANTELVEEWQSDGWGCRASDNTTEVPKVTLWWVWVRTGAPWMVLALRVTVVTHVNVTDWSKRQEKLGHLDTFC